MTTPSLLAGASYATGYDELVGDVGSFARAWHVDAQHRHRNGDTISGNVDGGYDLNSLRQRYG